MTPREQIQEIQRRVNQSVIGQERVVERLVIALLANGNVLVEGLPGLAKTRAIKSLSAALESEFSRIQFTPDLLPSDVTGGEIYLSQGAGAGTFEFRQGPIFGNLVLADEINRAPAKVQSALLEAMEERQVTVVGQALQAARPVHGAGDPESDRAGRHLSAARGADGPLPDACAHRLSERRRRGEGAAAGARRGGRRAPKRRRRRRVPQQAIFDARAEIDQIKSVDAVENYIVALIAATRRPAEYGDKLKNWITIGASPRGSLALDRASRVHAWLQRTRLCRCRRRAGDRP